MVVSVVTFLYKSSYAWQYTATESSFGIIERTYLSFRAT